MFGIPGSPKVLPGRPCLCCGGWPCQLVSFDHICSCFLGDPRGNFHSRTGEPVHSLNEILNVLAF